jgi:subtilisin family serine protease
MRRPQQQKKKRRPTMPTSRGNTPEDESAPSSSGAAPEGGIDTAPRLFGPRADNTVQGEVVVKLSAAGASAVTTSIPTAPLRGMTLGVPAGFGIDDVDAVLKRYRAVAVSRLHPPRSERFAAAAEEAALDASYRVRLAENADVHAAAAALSELASVERAEPNRWREATAVPNDPSFAAQWGLTRISCPEAWNRTTGAASVVVAVIDTGVDLDHPELAGHLLPGQDLVDLAGATPPPGTRFEGDWTLRDAEPQDEVGHGTHVAGTISCASNNAEGVAGVTWGCSILPVKVLTRVVGLDPPHRVSGVGSAVDIAAGIRWAVDHGARVLNMSLGGYSDTFVERDAIAYAVSRGAVVVAAMGNDATDEPSYPAAYPGVIAVGAIDQADRLAPFSNTGAHVALVAPGVDVLCTVWNDTYATMSGTSMASPHVAGVAALVLSANPALTADEVSDLLRRSAEPLRDDPSQPVPNDRYGSGLVNAGAAVAGALPLPPPFTFTMPPRTTVPPFTRLTMATQPTFPTGPTFPTRPTSPTFPTATRPTLPTNPTLPTRPTILTRPTNPTFPTRPTNPTFPTATRPTLPTNPTRPTLPTNPTNPTILTRPTFTRPTFPTRPTLPTNPTNPTNPTILTRPTLTRPTILTRPTLPTNPTILTRPTLTRPTVTRPTITIETRPTITRATILTRVPGTFAPQAAAQGAYGYEADPYGYGGGYGGGYEAYQDPYGAEAYQDPWGGYGYDAYSDPYAGYGYDPYADPYGGAYGAYGAGYGGGYGYDAYADPYAGYYGHESYDPYGTGSYDPYGTEAEGYYDPYGY